MIPKKPSDIIKQTAEDIGIPEEHMKAMVQGYYKEMKKRMRELQHCHIYIPGLGTMNCGRSRVKKAIWKFRQILESKRSSVLVENAKEQLNRLYPIEDQLAKEWRAMMDNWELKKQVRRQMEEDRLEQEKLSNNDTSRETETGMGEETPDS